jgi:hypothetical protein
VLTQWLGKASSTAKYRERYSTDGRNTVKPIVSRKYANSIESANFCTRECVVLAAVGGMSMRVGNCLRACHDANTVPLIHRR